MHRTKSLTAAGWTVDCTKYTRESLVLVLLLVALLNCHAQPPRVCSSVLASVATHAVNTMHGINATIWQPVTNRSGGAGTKTSLGLWTARTPVTNAESGQSQ